MEKSSRCGLNESFQMICVFHPKSMEIHKSNWMGKQWNKLEDSHRCSLRKSPKKTSWSWPEAPDWVLHFWFTFQCSQLAAAGNRIRLAVLLGTGAKWWDRATQQLRMEKWIHSSSNFVRHQQPKDGWLPTGTASCGSNQSVLTSPNHGYVYIYIYITINFLISPVVNLDVPKEPPLRKNVPYRFPKWIPLWENLGVKYLRYRSLIWQCVKTLYPWWTSK